MSFGFNKKEFQSLPRNLLLINTGDSVGIWQIPVSCVSPHLCKFVMDSIKSVLGPSYFEIEII